MRLARGACSLQVLSQIQKPLQSASLPDIVYFRHVEGEWYRYTCGATVIGSSRRRTDSWTLGYLSLRN